jgi:hypothetical protein
MIVKTRRTVFHVSYMWSIMSLSQLFDSSSVAKAWLICRATPRGLVSGNLQKLGKKCRRSFGRK